MNFAEQSFLPKEAGILSNLSHKLPRILRFGKPVADALAKPKEGKLVADIGGQVGSNAGQPIRMYDEPEIAQYRRKEIDHEGTGSFPVDLLSGAANKLTPKSWELKRKTQDALFNMKQKLTQADTAGGAFLGGNNISSLRGKMFSSPKSTRIGEITNADGSISPIHEGVGTDRRPSLVAPIQNGIKVVTPFLAATYVADKMYPREPTTPPLPQQQQLAFSALDYLEKMAEKNITKNAKNGIVDDEGIVWDMEKRAMLHKTAELEAELEKVAFRLQHAIQDNELLAKQAEFEKQAKEELAASYRLSKRETLEKKAAYEELRLRTIARERSKHAVKLAEDMLELGIIKQAQLDSQIDKLMECDEETFNLISSTAKQASKGTEGLESLAILSHYSNNDLESTSARPIKGLSKSGQTIGEAARDLIK